MFCISSTHCRTTTKSLKAKSNVAPSVGTHPAKRLFSWTYPLQVVRLLSGVGNRAEAQPPQGIVLLFPNLFGSFLFQLAAGAFVYLHFLAI